MRAIASPPVHVEGLGDVVVLPPCGVCADLRSVGFPGALAVDHGHVPKPGNVLAEVEQCDGCNGMGWHGDITPLGTVVPLTACPSRDCEGWSPPRRWWEVTEMLPVVRVWDEPHTVPQSGRVIDVSGHTPWVVDIIDKAGRVLTTVRRLASLTPPEPGSVVLVLSETTCPWCGGTEWDIDPDPDDFDLRFDVACRCTRPPSVTGDGPIVEVTW